MNFISKNKKVILKIEQDNMQTSVLGKAEHSVN